MSEALETKKQTRSRSLTATLSIAFVTLSVITLLVSSTLQLYFYVLAEQEVVTGEQQLIAQGAANQVTSFIQERFGELESAIKFSEVVNVSADTAKLTLEQLLGLEPAFRQLALVDGQGGVVAQASRLSQAAGKEVSSRIEAEALVQTRQGERYISPVYIDDETFEPLMIMAVPVTDVFGENQGTLIAEANLKFMWDLVDRLEIGDEGIAYVVNRQGDLLAFGDITRVIAGENLSQLSQVAQFVERADTGLELEETVISITPGIEGNNVLATYVPLGTPDWAVVTELPVAEAYRAVIQNTIIFGAIIIIVAVLAGVAGAYMARRLARPVQNLTDTASQVAEGDLRVQAEPEGATEIRQLAGAFNRMTGQLNELIESLEDRVAARTQRLETVAGLSEQLSAILNVDELLVELVGRVKERFGYYHAQVYIVSRESGRLVMREGAGEAGVQMKAVGHSISLDAPTSLVARSARTGQIVRVDNVREAEDWLPNPLLPDTYSEMAVPIILDGSVVGVLDVQEDKIAALDEGDAGLLRSLANQVAVTIRNARLFRDVETALAEAHAAQDRYIEEAWDKTRVISTASQYLYVQPNALPLDKNGQQTLAAAQQKAIGKHQPVVVADDSVEGSSVVAPVILHDKAIGSLQLHSTSKDQTWTEDDLAVLGAITEQFAQTAENLRLFDQTRSRAGREQTIREITDKMRGAASLDDLVKIAAEELGERLSAGHTVVKLGATTPVSNPTREGNGHG